MSQETMKMEKKNEKPFAVVLAMRTMSIIKSLLDKVGIYGLRQKRV
jgi:hypothetical protein